MEKRKAREKGTGGRRTIKNGTQSKVCDGSAKRWKRNG
jgi:hypothetical protein